MNYGDVIEYIENTPTTQLDEAREWCKNHNAELVELLDRREERIEFVPREEEQEVIIPAITHEEIDPETSDIIEVIDEPEHSETMIVMVEDEIIVIYYYFEIRKLD